MQHSGIPIKAAERIAKKHDIDQVIIIGRKVGEDGYECVTTYGIDKDNCDAAALIGNHLKYNVMGWPRDIEEAE